MAWHDPLRKYAKDAILWSVSADGTAQQQGPATVLQLAGAARELADQIPVDELTMGVTADWNDGAGNVHHPGLHVLLKRLAERFGELDMEGTIRALIDFLGFQRHVQEDIDQALTRFDIHYLRARDVAAVGLSPSVPSFMLLRAMNVGPGRWPNLFLKWGGQSPTTDD